MCNQDGWTAFLTAAYKGRTDVLLLLLERGANMEAASNVSNSTACILLLPSSCDVRSSCLCLCVRDRLDSIIHSPLINSLPVVQGTAPSLEFPPFS